MEVTKWLKPSGRCREREPSTPSAVGSKAVVSCQGLSGPFLARSRHSATGKLIDFALPRRRNQIDLAPPIDPPQCADQKVYL
jgi:hypothetical protein